MTFEPELLIRAEALIKAATAAGRLLATAESCTGGLVTGLLTEIAGSSAVVDRGFVVYSNEAKQDLLGVPEALLVAHGAVSAEVAWAMAEGALAHSRADIVVAITGIAGPGGGSAAKPVGLVHFGFAVRGGAIETVERRFGDIGRGRVRAAAIETSLGLFERGLAAPRA
jgi:nicotinamide-nucleotide amidase